MAKSIQVFYNHSDWSLLPRNKYFAPTVRDNGSPADNELVKQVFKAQ